MFSYLYFIIRFNTNYIIKFLDIVLQTEVDSGIKQSGCSCRFLLTKIMLFIATIILFVYVKILNNVINS